MAMIGRGARAIPSPGASQAAPTTGADKLFLLGALLSDLDEGGGPQMTMGAQQYLAQRGAGEAEREWQRGLLNSLTGDASEPRPAGASAQGAEPAQSGTPNMRDLLPLLSVGALRGYKGAGDLANIIDKAQPDIQVANGVAYDKRATSAGDRIGVDLSNVNGFMVDKQDPKNANRFFGEPPVKGAQPTFDQTGRHIGWQLMDGSLQAIQATRAAEQRGQVDETLYNVPADDGSNVYMRGRDYGGPGGDGLGRTQTPGAKVEQEGRGRTAAERAALEPKAATALGNQARTTDLVLSKIEEALGQINNLTAGPMSLTAAIPGSPAKNLSATLDTIRGNVGFDKLNEMRANSPTGGALGNVTERENAILQSVLGSIDQGQSQGQLRRNLEAIRDQLTIARDARRQAFDATYGEAAQGRERQRPAGAGGGGYTVLGVRRGGQ